MKIKKMLRKSLLILLGISLSSLISGCGLMPPDVPLCKELSMTRGYCIYTISSKEYEVNNEKLLDGKTWWEMRPEMISMPAQSWSKIKSFIIKICKKTGKCSTNISNWERTIKAIDEKVAR